MLRMKLSENVAEKIEDLLRLEVISSENDIAIFHSRNKTEHNQKPLANGGTAVVTINFKDVGLITGHSDCSIKDNYSRVTGRSIAIKRVLDARERKVNKL